MRIVGFIIAVALLLQFAASAERRPNVILIMADDLGREALACYGGTSYETPNFDALAADGMLFTHCYAQPICTPSRVKLMTGRSNARNYTRFGHLDPNEKTFGHMMQAAGYKTMVAGKWQLCGGDKHDGSFPDQAGFDEHCLWAYHHDLPGEVRETYTYFGKKPKKTSRYWNPAVVKNGKYVPTTTKASGPDIYADSIVDFMKRHEDDPFFVYYPMTLTHGPFEATPHSETVTDATKQKNDAAKNFGDMVRYAGHLVRKVQQSVKELGLAKDTLIMFTGDNGTHRSIVSKLGDRSVRGGKGLPLDPGIHVPLIAVWEGVIEPGAVSDRVVDFSDFMPTIAYATGADLSMGKVLDGRSFLSVLEGRPDMSDRTAAVIHYDKDPERKPPSFRRVRFAYDGRYKLYRNTTKPTDKGTLYDVANDPLEEKPLGDDAVPEVRAELEAWLNSLFSWSPDNSGIGKSPTERYREMVRKDRN